MAGNHTTRFIDSPPCHLWDEPTISNDSLSSEELRPQERQGHAETARDDAADDVEEWQEQFPITVPRA
jgi:hypothetical protein